MGRDYNRAKDGGLKGAAAKTKIRFLVVRHFDSAQGKGAGHLRMTEKYLPARG